MDGHDKGRNEGVRTNEKGRKDTRTQSEEEQKESRKERKLKTRTEIG